MTRRIQHFIGGKITAGTGRETAPVHNPATGEACAEVAFASVEDVKAAIVGAMRSDFILFVFGSIFKI